VPGDPAAAGHGEACREITARPRNVAYREQAESYGYTAAWSQTGWAVPVFVGNTDAKAVAQARPISTPSATHSTKMPLPVLLPPGYTSVDSPVRLAARGNVSHNVTLEDAIRDGMIICGRAATVREKLEQYHDDLRFGHLLADLHFAPCRAR